MANTKSYSGTKPKSSKCGTKRKSVASGPGEGQSPGELAKLRREDDDNQNWDQSPGKLAEDDDDQNSDEEDMQAVLDEMKRDKLLIQEGRYLCEVCLKEGDHFDCDCPYYVVIPKGAKIGSGYDIVCTECGSLREDHFGVLDEDWQGRVIRKFCGTCGGDYGHWYYECEKKEDGLVLLGKE